jgi:hypothetical protein
MELMELMELMAHRVQLDQRELKVQQGRMESMVKMDKMELKERLGPPARRVLKELLVQMASLHIKFGCREVIQELRQTLLRH